ncbi:hypothetical protein I204_07950 [Kwoniella mangroviensis CBS 8886]|nr:hypothetical protein I204_07950 [Kwoniella mangroviensis CBS 8886]
MPLEEMELKLRKGKLCSLAGLNSFANSSGSHDGNANDGRTGFNEIDKNTNGNGNGNGNSDLLEKIERQEKRYKQLEARFNQLEQRFISDHSRQNRNAETSRLTLNEHGHHDYHLDAHLPLPSKHLTKTSHPLLPQSWHGLIPVFDEHLLNATDPNSLPDAVELGLINKTQLEMGFQFLHIISTPIGHPIESPAPFIPSDHPSASESIRLAVSHLQQESDLVDRVREFLQTLYEVECEVEIEPDSLTRCIDQVTDYRKRIQEFRDGLHPRKDLVGYHSLEFDSRLIEFSLIMRLSILNQNLPSPFSPDLKLRGLSTIGTNYLPTSSALIDILLSQTNGLPVGIGGLPSYVIQSICLAYICLRRALFYIYSRRNLNQNEQVQYQAQIDLLARSQDILSSLGGSPALLVDCTNQQLGQLGDLGSFLIDNSMTTENINATNATNSHNNSVVSTNDHNYNHDQHISVDNNHNTLDMTHAHANIPIDWSTWDWSNLLVDPFSFDIGVGPVE